MDKPQNENNNSGFLFGFLLGIAAALLLTTKKGRKFLRRIIDQGIGSLSGFEEKVKDTLAESDDYIDGDDYVIGPESSVRSVDTPAALNTLKVEKTEKSEQMQSNEKTDINKADIPPEKTVHTEEKTAESATDSQEKPKLIKMQFSTRRFFKGINKRKK